MNKTHTRQNAHRDNTDIIQNYDINKTEIRQTQHRHKTDIGHK